jgi:hypothetical protein
MHDGRGVLSILFMKKTEIYISHIYSERFIPYLEANKKYSLKNFSYGKRRKGEIRWS